MVDAAAFAIGEHHLLGALDALVDVAGGPPTTRGAARPRSPRSARWATTAGRGAILAALDDKAPVRRRAVVALANFEGPEVDAALERAREDRDWQVRAAADQLGDDEDLEVRVAKQRVQRGHLLEAQLQPADDDQVGLVGDADLHAGVSIASSSARSLEPRQPPTET